MESQVVDQPKVPWAGFKYQPVRGLVDRKVSRFLRTQRKNMRRFFQERGHLDLFAQLDDIRKDSTRNFIQKNTAFQRILNEHIKRSVPATGEASPAGAPEHVGDAELDVRTAEPAVAVPGADDGGDPAERVLQMAPHDDDEPVIEE